MSAVSSGSGHGVIFSAEPNHTGGDGDDVCAAIGSDGLSLHLHFDHDP